MWYNVVGVVKVRLFCDCPNCGGDRYETGDRISQAVEADSPEEAAESVRREISGVMRHDDAEVNWRDEPLVTELGIDVALRKLGAVELPLCL